MTFELIIAIATLCNINQQHSYEDFKFSEVRQIQHDCRQKYFKCMEEQKSKNANALYECQKLF